MLSVVRVRVVHRRKKMKAMRNEKSLARKILTRTSVRRPDSGTRRGPAAPRSSADRQVAEIERTFTVRWEW
jgi:hypothetical protein